MSILCKEEKENDIKNMYKFGKTKTAKNVFRI